MGTMTTIRGVSNAGLLLYYSQTKILLAVIEMIIMGLIDIHILRSKLMLVLWWELFYQRITFSILVVSIRVLPYLQNGYKEEA